MSDLGLPSFSVREIIRKAFHEPDEFADLCKQANAQRRLQTQADLPRPATQGGLDDALGMSRVFRGVAALRGLPGMKTRFPADLSFLDRARELGSPKGRDTCLQERRAAGKTAPTIRYW